MKKIITVSEFAMGKSGVTNGKPWTIYYLTDENGVRYSTFDSGFEEKIGKQVKIEYEVKEITLKSGDVIKVRNIKTPNKMDIILEELAKLIVINTAINEKMNIMVSKLMPKVGVVKEENIIPKENEEDEINVDDIPFNDEE